MSDPTITLDQWKAALQHALGERHDAPYVQPNGAVGRRDVHVTDRADPQPAWQKPLLGELPRLLDAAPADASTDEQYHAVPARDAAACLPHTARHAVLMARQRRATGVVALAPRDQHGTVVCSVQVVLTPLPPGAEIVGTPLPGDAEVAATFAGQKDKQPKVSG